jgi:hypothetical protein
VILLTFLVHPVLAIIPPLVYLWLDQTSRSLIYSLPSPLRLDQPGGMDLDPLQIDGVSANRDSHLDPISGAVLPVSGGQMQQIRAVLGEQRVGREVGAVAT